MWMWIILGAAGAPYLLLPVLVKNTQRFFATPALRLLPGGFSSKIEHFFNSHNEQLSTHGFRHAFDALSSDYPGLKLYMRYYLLEKERICALATLVMYDDDDKSPPKIMLEFSTYFDNGTEIATSNNDLPGAPLEGPHRKSHTLHFVKNLSTLLNAHRYFIRNATAMPLTPAKGSEFDFFKLCLKKELSTQEKIGGLFLDESSGEYRPTWAGAFLMAWYTMWPVSFVRRLYSKQKARPCLKAIAHTAPTN